MYLNWGLDAHLSYEIFFLALKRVLGEIISVSQILQF